MSCQPEVSLYIDVFDAGACKTNYDLSNGLSKSIDLHGVVDEPGTAFHNKNAVISLVAPVKEKEILDAAENIGGKKTIGFGLVAKNVDRNQTWADGEDYEDDPIHFILYVNLVAFDSIFQQISMGVLDGKLMRLSLSLTGKDTTTYFLKNLDTSEQHEYSLTAFNLTNSVRKNYYREKIRSKFPETIRGPNMMLCRILLNSFELHYNCQRGYVSEARCFGRTKRSRLLPNQMEVSIRMRLAGHGELGTGIESFVGTFDLWELSDRRNKPRLDLELLYAPEDVEMLFPSIVSFQNSTNVRLNVWIEATSDEFMNAEEDLKGNVVKYDLVFHKTFSDEAE